MIPFVVQNGDLYYNTINGTLVKGVGALERNGFFSAEDPDTLADSVRIKMPRGDLSRISTVTLFTTTDCNAKCSYCYEKGFRRVAMTEKVARDAAEWIADRSDNVSIRLFGGEPLMNRTAIDAVCKTLKERGVKYKTSVVTNGLLLTNIPISWHLRKAQITLDGVGDNYLKEKGFKIDRALENIRSAIDDGIKVIIRLNVSKDNVSSLLEVCDLIASEPGLTGYAHELFEENPNYEGVNLVNKRLMDLNVCSETRLPKYRDGFCMADQGKAVCITPEGNLTLCEHHCEDEIIGSIYSDSIDWNVAMTWREFVPQNEECKLCFYRPICHKLRKCVESFDTCTEDYRSFKYKEIQQKMEYIAKNALRKKVKTLGSHES